MSRETNLQLLWKLSYIQSVTVDLFRNSYCSFGTIARLTFYLILYPTLMLFLLLGCSSSTKTFPSTNICHNWPKNWISDILWEASLELRENKYFVNSAIHSTEVRCSKVWALQMWTRTQSSFVEGRLTASSQLQKEIHFPTGFPP